MLPADTSLRTFFTRLVKTKRMRAAWRLVAWGLTAAVAAVFVVLAAQTDRGRVRIQSAFFGVDAKAQQAALADAQRRAAEAQAETRRLSAQIAELTANRERLETRIASLERNVGDITGSIKHQAELAVAAAMPGAADLPKIAAPAPPAPAMPKGEPAEVLQQEGAPQGGEPPKSVSVAAAPAPANPAAEPVRPIVATSDPPSDLPKAAPLPAAAPVRQLKIASVPEAAPVPPQPVKSDVGIDIGGSSTLALLNARWKTVKANHGPLLVGLHPRVAHENRPGRLPYRLVLGPLPNAAAAARLCAQFAAAHAACHPTHFAGTALAPD